MFFLYLKKIYIQGFKSFADKTEIKFNNEVTAIIGPNGSGKSNISDAIRWVLGEQSIKNLRGSKMEDVIFSGTDKRRALGFAEVSIVLDNTDQQIPIDYNEVAITRRMFRSGDSEFYINKNSCRLKDIRELLMDTGVGKEGYSIIGQGRIDEILSTKSVDRRGIFEEAAGIVKFKSKKIEAERKLEKTQNNILRIEDLIYEVENQRNQVEEEAKKTEKFNEIFVKLKELEVNKYIDDINRLDEELKKLNLEEEKISREIDKLMVDKASIENSYSILKKDIAIKEAAIEESRNVKFTTIQDFEKNKNQISLLIERENYLNNEIKRLNSFNSDIKERHKIIEIEKENLSQELEESKTRLEKQVQDLKSKEEVLMDLRGKINNEDLKLEEKKDELLTLYSEISLRRSEKSSSLKFMDTIELRLKEIRNERDKIIDSKEAMDDDFKALSIKLQDTIELFNINKDKIDQINLSYENRYNELKKIKEKINNFKINLNGLNSNFNLMTNLESEYDGYYNSIKKFLKAINRANLFQEGFVGVVADLITIKDIYLKAIEVSLGSSLQHIVVNNERDAKEMINFLKDNRIGRVTFLPKNTIKAHGLSLNEKIKREYNIIGLAHELVGFDESNKEIVKYLLGRTIIIKDMDSAIKYSKFINYKYKIVTLEGEQFNPGGSITGGSLGDNRISILGRKNKLKKLQSEIELEKNNLNFLLRDEESTEEELKKIALEREGLEGNLISLKEEITDIKNRIVNRDNDLNRLKDDLKRKTREEETLSSELKTLLEGQDSINDVVRSLEEDESKLKKDIDLMNKLLKDEKEKTNALDEEQTNLTIKINSLKNQKNNLTSKLSDMENEKDNLSKSLEKNNLEIESLEKDIIGIGREKDKIKLDQTIFNEKEKELSDKLTELINSKDVLMKRFYKEQDDLKVINEGLSKLEKNLNSIKVKIARYEVERENFHYKLEDEYNLEFSEALKYKKDMSQVKNIKKVIEAYKTEIRNLGNVNINALEEFKSINERYEFMTKQYEDLINSKKDLNQVIKEMDKSMKTQFVKEFNIINQNFKKVFTALFNGGYAELEIVDEDNILESGIDIIVQPPGKKLQYLNLLSGGEKSLTAVALLFAILMTKPSPFCILDEIDAALDEANINRYINYLKNFSDSIQFILITHRKTTMEIADVLYGVTMEEQGVSKLISVKLKDEVVAS